MKTENQNISTNTIKWVTVSAIALWFTFAFFMSITGGYQAGAAHPPLPLGLTFLIPIISFVVTYWSSNSFRQFANGLDLKIVTGAHVWRLVGFDFLYRYLQGQLPGGFALPAGIGDILVASTAIPMALAISRQAPSARKKFVVWNVFGIIDLCVAVGMGLLFSQSALGILAGKGPSTLMMSDFPRAIIPTFFVPLFILLHLLALARRNEVVTRHEQSREVGIQTSLSPYHP